MQQLSKQEQLTALQVEHAKVTDLAITAVAAVDELSRRCVVLEKALEEIAAYPGGKPSMSKAVDYDHYISTMARYTVLREAAVIAEKALKEAQSIPAAEADQ